jgi:8-oxo-dGTP pyrophosphatase MutT (NUDIX family)
MSARQKSALVLPYQGNKILMQLRDEKSEIPYPGYWAFFGGTIEPGENSIRSAQRELYEEIGYNADKLFALSVDRVWIPYFPQEIMLYSFYCLLDIPLEDIVLCEGFDLGLFTLEEICSKRLFSEKAQKTYPIIDFSSPVESSIPYAVYLVRKLMHKICL